MIAIPVFLVVMGQLPASVHLNRTDAERAYHRARANIAGAVSREATDAEFAEMAAKRAAVRIIEHTVTEDA